MKLFIMCGIAVSVLYELFRQQPEASVERQANNYFPVQSDSERAAGHPLVGAS